jgi:hypothetical protein
MASKNNRIRHFTLLNYLQQHPGARAIAVLHDIQALAVAYAVVFTSIACACFVFQRCKGWARSRRGRRCRSDLFGCARPAPV